MWSMPIGARPSTQGTHFRVWAAGAGRVELLIYSGDEASQHALQPEAEGYFAAFVPGAGPGTRYAYRVDGSDPRPDPASRFQPAGVHGPSQVVDPAAFAWSDNGWQGVALADLVVYELHVGTATDQGTFDALIGTLDAIRALGATAIELMPVADFPGQRNWGYDGVSLFAPARAYGGPEALRRLVDAAHTRGLGVILDVVYNHLGPEGNYLRQFSPHYFTERHHTPWGAALNFDSAESVPVRTFFVANALHWAHEYHLDGLRLDATHAILDDSPTHILAELIGSVRGSLPQGRQFLFVAENEHNDPLVVSGREQGWGFDAVWADDFHHQVRVALAGDRDGYYADYSGSAADLAATLRQGWFYTGQHSPALDKPRGTPAADVQPAQFVYCIQNHDQVGNRALGDRLNHTVGLAAYCAASALLLLSPATPLLWMGQEWGASSPFLFFSDFSGELGRLVTEGRRKEFAAFAGFAGSDVPDPQAEQTFLRSKLRWNECEQEPHASVLRLYTALLALRASHPALQARGRAAFAVTALGATALAMRRNDPAGTQPLLLVLNLYGTLQLDLRARPETLPPAAGWHVLLDTQQERFGGQGGAQLLEAGAQLAIEGPGALVLSAPPAHAE